MANLLYQSYRRYYAFIEPVAADPLVRGYFSLVASLFLIAFLAIFALSPTINTILGLRKKISDQTRVIAALDAKTASLVAAQQNYSALEEVIPLLNTALPEKPQPQGIIAGVLSTATSAGVTVTGLQFQELSLTADLTTASKEKKTTLPAAGFSLTAAGSPSQIRTFLGGLENLLRYIRVETISFTETAADVVGVGYYYLGSNEK